MYHFFFLKRKAEHGKAYAHMARKRLLKLILCEFTAGYVSVCPVCPSTLGTTETQQFQAPRYRRDWRDSVISAAHVRCGQTGTQSPQSPRYFGHWRDSVIPSHMVTQAPSTVRTRGTQPVQPPRCPRKGWTQSFQSPAIFRTGENQSFHYPGFLQPPGSLGTCGTSIFS